MTLKVVLIYWLTLNANCSNILVWRWLQPLFGGDDQYNYQKIHVFDCWERQEDVDLHYILSDEKKQIIYVAVKRRQYQVPNQCQHNTLWWSWLGIVLCRICPVLINTSITISFINTQYISPDLIFMAIKTKHVNLWWYLVFCK